MNKQELQHAYFLLCGFVDNLEEQLIERNYLLELQKWFIEQFENIEKSKVCKVKPCENSMFHGIGCLESSDQFGFFKSKVDVRPSSCTWVNKDKAEMLYQLFGGSKDVYGGKLPIAICGSCKKPVRDSHHNFDEVCECEERKKKVNRGMNEVQVREGLRKHWFWLRKLDDPGEVADFVVAHAKRPGNEDGRVAVSEVVERVFERQKQHMDRMLKTIQGIEEKTEQINNLL